MPPRMPRASAASHPKTTTTIAPPLATLDPAPQNGYKTKENAAKYGALDCALLSLKKADYAAFVYAHINFKMTFPELMAIYKVPVHHRDGRPAKLTNPTIQQVEDTWQNKLMPHILNTTPRLPESTIVDIIDKFEQYQSCWLDFRMWAAKNKLTRATTPRDTEHPQCSANTGILIATQILTLLNHPPTPPTPDYYIPEDIDDYIVYRQ